MPSWKIHSYIGNQVNKTIKVNKKYFMIGNLLPDQDRYNIGNLKRNIPRTTTHFIKREDYLIGINLPYYDKMYNKYKDKFKNPVLMGYLVHLLTDYYFNNYKSMSIVKWVGGKSKILNKFIDEIPDNGNTYYEPFVGSASVLIKVLETKNIIIILLVILIDL